MNIKRGIEMGNATLILTLCDGLDLLLNEIKRHPDSIHSEYLNIRLELALKANKDIYKEAEKVLGELQVIAKELLDIQDAQTKIAGPYLTQLLKRFKPIYEAGGTPELISKVAALEGVNKADTVRILHNLFDLSLVDAQVIVDNS